MLSSLQELLLKLTYWLAALSAVMFFVGSLIEHGIFGIDSLIRISDLKFAPMLRSLIFAACVSVGSVALGIYIAVSFSTVRDSAQKAIHKFSMCLLIPFLLGSTVVAYIFKYILRDQGLFSFTVSSGGIAAIFLVGIILIWQYSTLVAYVGIFTLSVNRYLETNFALHNKLPHSKIVSDVFLPKLKSISTVLILIFFCFSFYEYSMLYLLYKPSVAMNNELISHALTRGYRTFAGISPDAAIDRALLTSLFSFPVCVMGAFSAVLIFRPIFKLLPKFYKEGDGIEPQISADHNSLEVRKFVIFLVCLLSPVLVIFPFMINATELSAISSTLGAMLPSLVVSVFIIGMAILAAILARLYWRRYVNVIDMRFVIFVAISSMALAIPPLSISIATLDVRAVFVGYSAVWLIITWGVSMMFVLLPIFIVFMIASYTLTKERELDFTILYKLDFTRSSWLLFGKRYVPIYFFSLLVCTSVVFHEATVNAVFSEYITSAPSILNILINGRAANEPKAMAVVMMSLIFAILIIFTWRHTFSNIIKGKS